MIVPVRSLAPFIFALLLLWPESPQNADAAQSRRPTHYLNGVAPHIVNRNLAVKSHELIYDNFTVMHSGISRTPLWAAEHLTNEAFTDTKKSRLPDDFHTETRLQPRERSEPKDYRLSGYIPGQLAPTADMPTAKARTQSFILSNVIPRNRESNAQLWPRIESSVREYAMKKGELYVITGPLFIGRNLERLNGRVLVPTHIYKLVFDPGKNIGAAYFVRNEPSMQLQVLSIPQLEKIAGINFFPKLSDAEKGKMLKLPEPKELR